MVKVPSCLVADTCDPRVGGIGRGVVWIKCKRERF